MLFELLYDGNSDVYIWRSLIYYYPNESNIKRYNQPDRIGIQERTHSEIDITNFMDVNDIIDMINSKYELDIIEYFNENYTDIRCSCVYRDDLCEFFIIVDSEFNTDILFNIDLNEMEVNFVSKSNLNSLNID